MASLSAGIFTPRRLYMSVGGCIPPFLSPFAVLAPACQAISPSPVQSIMVRARMASLPDLLSMITPFTLRPSVITSTAKTYISTSTPLSCMMERATSLAASGLMMVRLIWFLQRLCSLALPSLRKRSMKFCGKPFIFCLPLQLRNERIGKPIVRFPPKNPRLSNNMTFWPFIEAASAAIIPVGPPPIMSVSTSARTGICLDGSVIVFMFYIFKYGVFYNSIMLSKLLTYHFP